MTPEETVDYNIKVAWHAISRMYNTQAAKHDITTSIGFVLLNIDQELGTPATKIAPLLGLETRSLTRILRSMEEKGLIYKQADTQDKRSVRIFLTEEGLRKKEVSRQTVRHFNQKVREKIPQAQLEVMFKVVGQITGMIEGKTLFDDFKLKPYAPNRPPNGAGSECFAF
ncbi:MarR family winged helix-turn-helix transcriptional regulator [Hymenobacter cellulosilyticus]|uniref:MarR family transcriptional regulator n=1 Tax=Hymenobacter cellulosilyticus TaxID=2932248 RepID=A0A8T9Q9Z8_9BACT|nr:MarR family transcriptional regulator [Hymenobacter cellulosilyticus]UOQ73802.1 MarR family transcriptional regulator [Hymenobacter cellulosilyticus]